MTARNKYSLQGVFSLCFEKAAWLLKSHFQEDTVKLFGFVHVSFSWISFPPEDEIIANVTGKGENYVFAEWLAPCCCYINRQCCVHDICIKTGAANLSHRY